MLIHSGSGTPYAVLASNDDAMLAIHPTFSMLSTTVLLRLRLRFSVQNGPLDPMLIPKRILCTGIETGRDSLRAFLIYNSATSVDKLTKHSAEKLAKAVEGSVSRAALLKKNSTDDLYGRQEKVYLYQHDRVPFVEDFTKLVTEALKPVYPPLDTGALPTLLHQQELNNALTDDILSHLSDGEQVKAKPVEGNVTQLMFDKGDTSD